MAETTENPAIDLEPKVEEAKAQPKPLKLPDGWMSLQPGSYHHVKDIRGVVIEEAGNTNPFRVNVIVHGVLGKIQYDRVASKQEAEKVAQQLMYKIEAVKGKVK